MKKLLLLALLAAPISAQTLTTYTGTVKDLSGVTVTSGRVTFTLNAPSGGHIPGIGTFVASTVSCLINGSGTPVSSAGGPCTIVNNSALTPTGTSYTMCVQPFNATPGSCLVTFANGGTVDISTVVPTPTTQPSYGVASTVAPNTWGQLQNFPGGITGTTATFGGPLGFNHFTMTNLSTMPAPWTFDYTTPQTATNSLGNNGATTATFGTVSSKISPVHSVKAWGAACDGVTDDSAAILAAIASSNVSTSNSGAALSLPSTGFCRVTQPIIFTTDNLIQIIGTGPGSGFLCDYATWVGADYNCLEYQGTSGHFSVSQTFSNFTVQGANNSGVVSTGFSISHGMDHNGGVFKIVGLNVDNVRAQLFDTGFSISDVTESNFRHLSAIATRQGYALLGQNVNDTFDTLIFDSATNANTSSVAATQGIILDGKTYPDTAFYGPEGINLRNSVVLGAATDLSVGAVLQSNIDGNIFDLATGDTVVMGQTDGCPNGVNFTHNYAFTTGANASLFKVTVPTTCNGLNVADNYFIGSSTSTGQNGIYFGAGLNWAGNHFDRNRIWFVQHPMVFASIPHLTSIKDNWGANNGDVFINETGAGTCGNLTVNGNTSTSAFDIADLTCTGAVMGINSSTVQTTGAYFPSAATFSLGFNIGSGQTFTGTQGSTGTKVFAATGSFTNAHLVSVDSNGNGVDAGLAVSAVPTVATPTAGHASCIKGAGPPVLIGYCSTQPDASGNCTCN